jgi:hypothetical protein
VAPVVPPLHIPDRRGGWWHEYVCPAHGTQLLPSLDGVFPCPHGCTLTGEPYAGAWAVLAHQAAARSLRSLAVTARDETLELAGRAAAADAAVAGLCRYAELYRRLAGEIRADAQPWMLAGKLFQQALTEAIWGTSIALAVQTLAGVVPTERLQPVAELLRALRSEARRGRDVLVERDDFRNNYTAWLDAAGATTSRALALLGEPDETSAWVSGPHGLTEHLAAAVYPDGWEWEGSTYYHVFVLRAYLLAVRGRPDLLSAAVAGRLVDMVGVVASLATDKGGVLPALNDTPYGDPGWDEEIYELCLLAAELPGVADLGFLAEPLSGRLPAEIVGWREAEARDFFSFALHTDTQRPGIAYAYAEQSDARGGSGGGGSRASGPKPPDRGSRLFGDAGYAVLAGDGYRAVLDLGPHGGSHGHLDKLALYLYGPSALWMPAYGVPPYAHPWRRGYYRATAAHPTLTVDDADQAETDGRLLYWRSGARWAEVGATADVYPGVRFERHLRAEAGWLLDVVQVSADRIRDLTLHLRTDVNVTVRHGTDGAETHWPGDGGLTGLHATLCTAPDGGSRTAVLSTGADLGPADDPQRSRPHLRWRGRGESAVYASVYAPAWSPVAGLHLERSATDLTVLVDRSGAEPVRWSIPEAQRSR